VHGGVLVQQLGFLLFSVLLPIFLQIGAGYALQKRFPLNTATLSKVQFYIFIPAITFTSLYATRLDTQLLGRILLANLLLFILLLVLAITLGRKLIAPPKRRAFSNAVCLYNSGNYCIPLVQLLYQTPLAYSVQIIIMLLQTIITSSFGILNSQSQQQHWSRALWEVLRMPMTLAMLAAVVLRLLEWQVWPPIWNTLDVVAKGMVPLALVTLGAQLANTRLKLMALDIYLAALVRLLLAPLLALLLVKLCGITGVAAQVVVICSAAPTAVNTVLLALEFGGDAEFASRSVLCSTLLSALTMPLVIAAALALL